MIIDTLLIYSAPVVALFDFGSTHIFVAKTFANRIGVSIENTSYDLAISTIVRAFLTTGVCGGVSL